MVLVPLDVAAAVFGLASRHLSDLGFRESMEAEEHMVPFGSIEFRSCGRRLGLYESRLVVKVPERP